MIVFILVPLYILGIVLMAYFTKDDIFEEAPEIWAVVSIFWPLALIVEGISRIKEMLQKNKFDKNK